MANGVHLTGRIDGNVTVSAGAAEASADATLGEPEGNVIAYAQGRNVIGVSARSPKLFRSTRAYERRHHDQWRHHGRRGAASAYGDGTGPAHRAGIRVPALGHRPADDAATASAGNAIRFGVGHYAILTRSPTHHRQHQGRWRVGHA